MVHLEVRLNALQKLVASIDSTTTWDAEMVAKVDEALSAFGGGFDPAVNAAVARIRARVDERAALVAERVAERFLLLSVSFRANLGEWVAGRRRRSRG